MMKKGMVPGRSSINTLWSSFSFLTYKGASLSSLCSQSGPGPRVHLNKFFLLYYSISHKAPLASPGHVEL